MFVIVSTAFLFNSCSKDNSNGGQSFGSTYLYALDISQLNKHPHYYSEIDNAISNNELLYTYEFWYEYGKKVNYHYYYATRDLFVNSQGQITTYNEERYGRFSDVICSSYSGYLIQDSSTILDISLHLCADEDWETKPAPWKNNCSKLKTVYKGKNFESLSWYISKRPYTYLRQDNKIVLSNGRIFTIIGDELFEDGSSYPHIKFDLNSLK